MSKITDRVWKLAEPVAAQFGLRIWDIEYVREGADWFLRVYIDKDGPVDINDCENVSRALDPILDEEDPIPDSYTFEVCSAGCEIFSSFWAARCCCGCIVPETDGKNILAS